MRKLPVRTLLNLVVLSILSIAFPYAGHAQPAELTSLAELVKRLKPSVVNISTTSVVTAQPFQFRSPFGGGENDPFEEFFDKFFGGEGAPQREFRQRGLGSGFIMSEDGYIITNNHVIEKARDISVILEDGGEYEAKVIGKDPKTDVALLKIEPDRKLQAISFGNSDQLEIGDWVVAIGNPFGLGHTVTTGIVSAKGRSLGLGAYDDFIQTDAAINPGNSGGPLFNLRGNVVGVNTAIIAGGQGIGFAIPANIAKYVVNQLRTEGKVVRGWLGVMVQQITPEIAESLELKDTRGALVADVTPGGPADKAGVKRGDVIVEFNGNKIKEMAELPKTVATTSPGTESELKLLRNGNEKVYELKLGILPDEVAQSGVTGEEIEKDLGLVVQELSPQIQRRLGIQDAGVVITNVRQGSVAAEAGLQPGDIVLEVNRKKVESLGDYRKAMDSVKGGETALFLVKRDNNTIYVAIKADVKNDKG